MAAGQAAGYDRRARASAQFLLHRVSCDRRHKCLSSKLSPSSHGHRRPVGGDPRPRLPTATSSQQLLVQCCDCPDRFYCAMAAAAAKASQLLAASGLLMLLLCHSLKSRARGERI
eukprot:COSAG06_NODE_3427_length_5361_cov_715.776923_6_plen_115_part_00